MKKYLLIGGLIATSLIATGLFVGCGTTPNTVAYQSVGTTQVTADGLLDLWGAYVTAQKAKGTPVPVTQELAVRSAFQKVQASMLVVCDAGAVWSSAVTTNSSGATGLAAAFQVAVSGFNQSLTDFQNLLKSYGVTLP